MKYDPTYDPYEALGVARDADEATIRQAYLARLREFPPERAPEAFERVRDAYQALSDPGRRAALVLVADLNRPFASLAQPGGRKRTAAGLDVWLEVVAEARDGR